MEKALIAKDVPEEAIYCDYAGLTTLDTVVRAREVFGQTRFTVISQQFQSQQRILGFIREYVARGRAVLDANLIRRQPHFTGPAIVPGKASAASCAG